MMMCYKKYILFVTIVTSCALTSCNSQKGKTDAVNNSSVLRVPDKFNFANLEDVKMSGVVGKDLDQIIDKRIAGDVATQQIAPEATKAFKIRKDDEFYEGRGLWQGEFWGKWILSAIAAYQYTGDIRIKNAISKETIALIATQDKDGYIGSYKDAAFVEGDVWNVWNEKYTLWGLVESYELLKDPAILKAAEGMMDHLMTIVGPGKISIVNTGNFYGLPSSSILTPLVKLYLNTKEKKYLDYSNYIVNEWHSVDGNPPHIVEKGLTGAPVHQWFPEKGKWTKAYEFISCVEGLIDLYQVVGNEDYIKAAKNIYKAIQENERVITGGIGYHDKLVGASSNPGGLNEPCDVVYWERLSAKLLQLTGDQTYADEIERLTYNVLLASFNYEGDWGVRRLGLNEPHLVSPLHCFTNYQQCCVANVPRGLLQLGQVAVMSSAKANDLLVNLYIPGDYKVKLADGKEVTLTVKTDYPKNGEVKILMNADASFKGTLSFRKPDWCEDFSINVNNNNVGRLEKASLKVNRDWKNGDVINLNMGVQQRIIGISDKQEFKAIMWGPVVLARSSILEGFKNLDSPVDMNGIKITPVENSENTGKIWMQFNAITKSGEIIKLCDYSSTGREYTKPTDPAAWEEMIKNRVSSDQRVWLKTK